MLARLDEDLAPVRSAVDREGRFLRLHDPGPSPDLTERVVALVQALGYVAEPVESAPGIPLWFGAADTDELSQEEASVLARRWVEELGSDGVIPGSDRVIEPLRAMLLDTFRSAARTGSIAEPELDGTALREVLDEPEVRTVLRWLARKLARPDPA